ncbi:hypothetical protein [Sinorhizobium fredii]|uniref:hypothetical protein n=1 Tax=Rhizobium fredii TaxID=380 RepID=UPI0004B731BD|nr:hypothetical protein [Sinorhizobium fredii]
MDRAERAAWLEKMRFWHSLDNQITRLADHHREQLRRHGPPLPRPQPRRDDDLYPHRWQIELLLRDDGLPGIASNFHNCCVVIRDHPEFSSLFMLKGRNHVVVRAPLLGETWLGFRERSLTGDDISKIHAFVQDFGLVTIDRQTLTWAIRRVAAENKPRTLGHG